MRLFQLARTPRRLTRHALAALVLAFCLNAFAHASHTHSDAVGTNLHATCGYCITFDSLHASDAPVLFRGAHAVAADVAIVPVAVFVSRPATSACPRGPPL